MQGKGAQGVEEGGNPFLQVNRFEVEESAVFIDFTAAQILKSLQDYGTLNIYHRLSLAKNIAAIREILPGHEDYYRFLLALANDSEELQLQLLDFLRKAFQRGEVGDCQREFVLPLTRLVTGHFLEVKEGGCALLAEVSRQAPGEERQAVLALALELERSEDEENRLIAIQLIARLTPDMLEQEAESLFRSAYVGLYREASVRIKKEIIHSSGVLARSVRREFLNRELIEGFFSEKCRESIWGVRKACVEVLPQLVLLTDSRKEHLAHLLLGFTRDGNKIVKIAAFKIIPEFIANYNSPKVPEKLVELYVGLMDNEINHSLNRENEIVGKVAFYFPGVMQTLGAGRWEQMKKLFNRLLFSKSNEVKLPIASSLHEVSRIIGPDLSKEYMFTALDNILKDSSDLLKLTAISHLSEFVELFEKTTRENLIDVFLVLQKDPKKWRVRYEIAHQLNTLSKIYETETVFKYIFPISLKLCNDNVNEVRFEAAAQLYHVIDNMKESELFQEMALESIKGYGLSEKYIQRETFAFMVRNLYRLATFRHTLMDMILELTRDSVVVVRIALAISLSQIAKEDPEGSLVFREAIQALRQDEEDVSEYFQQE